MPGESGFLPNAFLSMRILKKNIHVRGSALVVVLAITLLLAAMTIALVFSARVEGQTSRAVRERVRAQLAADEGVEVARSLLASAFDNASNQVVTMPGRLMIRRPGDQDWQTIELSTGAASGGVDMNRVVRSGDGFRLLDPLGEAMYLNWVWMRKDGTRIVQQTPPPYDVNNPLVARYAFWVDDEATKVNLNTARRRMDNGHVPAQIDISAVNEQITESDADLIFGATKQRPLQSVREVTRMVDDPVAEAVSQSRLAFTHFNRSSNLNPWGEPKIILTTQAANLPESIRNLPEAEREKYFIDVLTNSNGSVDPGFNSSLSFPKLTRFLNRLNESLTRRDWPLKDGLSYHDKFKSYAPESEKRITQLALDIVQYVRAAESSSQLTALIRGYWSGANFVAASTQESQFVSMGRAPLITEVTIWVSGTAVNADGSYNAQLRFELYSPPNYNLGELDLSQLRLTFQATGKSIFSNQSFEGYTMTPSVLPEGGYAVITTPVFPLRQIPNADNPDASPYILDSTEISNRLWLRLVVQYRNAANAFDIIEQAPAGNRDAVTLFSGIEFRTSRPAANVPALGETGSSEVDDPRLNKTTSAWVRRSSANSFGESNSIWKLSPAAEDGLPQDKDGTGYSDYSLMFPPLKGLPGNLLGRVSSIGELGRVVSGIETSGVYFRKAVPWRTLRLQPTSTSDTTLPDWMLLELFAVPVVPDPGKEEIYFTGKNLIAGRLNINTAMKPFEGLSKGETLGALFGDRDHPAIQNLLTFSRASGGRIFGGDDFLALPGEVAEIRGVSDTGEGSEEVFRKIITQMTTSSRTFTIYAVGESIVQSPSGNITISGSRTVEVMVAPVDEVFPLIFSPISWQAHPL